MNISVIGASAGVGFEVVKRALERGHNVTCISRGPIRIPGGPGFLKIQGDVLLENNLTKAIKSADAVIVTLGNGQNISKTTLFSDFARLAVKVTKNYNPQIPFIILTGFGAGESLEYYPFFLRMGFKLILGNVYGDKTKMEKIFTNSDIPWTIVRPGLLTNRSLTESYQVNTSLKTGLNINFISRADVADFMVKEAENQAHAKEFIYFG